MIIKDIEKIDIINELSKIRSANERLHQDRLSEIYEKISEIKDLDNEITTLSIEEAKSRILKGTADNDIAGKISSLSEKKKELLRINGYDEDYLEPIYSCPLCKDEGYSDGHVCSCAKKIRIQELYKRSNLNAVFKKENFSTFSLDVYSKEPFKDQKQDGTTIPNCSIILQEIGGQFENTFACTLLGNAAECKYFPNDYVWASLRFSTREYQGQYYQDILVQDIISFTNH